MDSLRGPGKKNENPWDLCKNYVLYPYILHLYSLLSIIHCSLSIFTLGPKGSCSCDKRLAISVRTLMRCSSTSLPMPPLLVLHRLINGDSCLVSTTISAISDFSLDYPWFIHSFSMVCLCLSWGLTWGLTLLFRCIVNTNVWYIPEGTSMDRSDNRDSTRGADGPWPIPCSRGQFGFHCNIYYTYWPYILWYYVFMIYCI